WVRRQIDEIEAELVGERTRREGAERRDRTMQAQIAKEVEVQQALKQERDKALDEVVALKARQGKTQQDLKREGDRAEALKATVKELTQARSDAEAREAQAQQDLKRERNTALDEAAALKAKVEELMRARGPVSRPQPITQPGQGVYLGYSYVTTEK